MGYEVIAVTLPAHRWRWLAALPRHTPVSRPAARDEPYFVRIERAIVQVRWLVIVMVAVAAPFAGLTPVALLGT